MMSKYRSGIVAGYNHEGMGVIRQDDQVYFLPGALLGETLVFAIPQKEDCVASICPPAKIKDKKKGKSKVAWGEVITILDPSPHRQPAPCPYYGCCGGCQLQHANDRHQLSIKYSIMTRALAPLRKMDPGVLTKLLPVLPGTETTGYRNKGIFAVEKNLRCPGKGNAPVQIGFYGSKSHHVASQGCPLLFSHQVNGLIEALAFWLTGEDVKIGKEGLHHVMIRESKTTGRLILVLIGAEKPPWLPRFVTTFAPIRMGDQAAGQPMQAAPCLAGIGWLTAPAGTGPVITGQPETLWGTLGIEEVLSSVKYSISPQAFFQVNTAQAGRLYDLVAQAAALTGREALWDLYCGSGTISLYLARQAKAVLGIDSVAPAIKDAWANARINDQGNLCFLAGPAEILLPDLAGPAAPGAKISVLHRLLETQQTLSEETTGQNAFPAAALLAALAGPPDVVVLDPPAKGADPAVLQAILQALPQRIVYVSCDPATLTRDLQLLCAADTYTIKTIQPVDMFPQTAHVECVVLLTAKRDAGQQHPFDVI